MTVIILCILLAVGILADIPTDLLPVKTLHDNSEIVKESASDLWTDLLLVKTHQYNSEIVKESASDVWTDQLAVKSESPLTSEVFYNNGSGCDFPFEEIGNNCYYFSDNQLSYFDALAYCESLSIEHTYVIMLAMLDYGSEEEDQAILDAVSINNKTVWLGGRNENENENDTNWKWLDNRDIYLQAPFWYLGEPVEDGGECIVAQSINYLKNLTRSYLYSNNCNDSFHFICQIFCPEGFRRIGNHCYMLPEDLNVDPLLEWQEARDYCSSLSVPEGYHADLAVLGLPDQDDYHLLNNLAENYHDNPRWIGVDMETECNYTWIDKRELPLHSIYWSPTEPSCGLYNHAALVHFSEFDRSYLVSYTDFHTLSFICQIFKVTNTTSTY